jgi:hypothetical protein
MSNSRILIQPEKFKWLQMRARLRLLVPHLHCQSRRCGPEQDDPCFSRCYCLPLLPGVRRSREKHQRTDQ